MRVPCLSLVVLGVGLTASAFAAQQNRLALGISPAQDTPVLVRGSVHPLATANHDLGRMESSRVISGMALIFSRTAEQQAEITQLENSLHDSNSPQYHQWLTPAQIAQRFGVSDSDLQDAAGWLRAQGFTVDDIPASRDRVVFSGSVSTIERAFGTQMHRYQARGTVGFGNATELKLPKGLAANIIGVRNLSNFPLKARAVARRVAPHLTSEITGSTFVTPDDFATIFGVKALYANGMDGTGETIAVIGQTNIDIANVRAFRTAAGLPPNDPVLTPTVAGSTASSSDDLDEAYLDVEWSGAIANKATVKYVWTPIAQGGVFAALDFAITNNVAPIITISYGSCELDNGASDFTQIDGFMHTATLQGQTLIAASGDQGAADCESATATTSTRGLAVDVPASLPDVVGIGGTRFSADANSASVFWAVNSNTSNGSALSYIGETSWNDTVEAQSLSSTGGGSSVHYARPTWQNLAEMPVGTHRLVPDISFPASPDHDGYLMCGAGTCVNGFRQANSNFSVIGGTSVGAPAFASVLALMEQASGTSFGSLNRVLYPASQASAVAFHDITSGDNKVPCSSTAPGCGSSGTIGFSAGPGYDLVTGLGTPDAFNLEEALNAGTKTITKTTVTSAVPAPAVNAPVTITAKTTPLAGSGSMQLFVDGALSGTPVAVTAGTAAFPNVLFSTPGNHAVSVSYLGSAGNAGSDSQSQQIFVSTTQPAAYKLGLNPGAITLSRAGANATSTVLGTSINNYSGSVTLTCTVTAGVTSAVLPSCTFPPSQGPLTLSTQQATANTTITVTVPAPVALLKTPLGPKHNSMEWWAAGSTAAFGCVFLFPGRLRRKYTGVALLVIAGVFVGCGGGGGNSASTSATSTTTTSSSVAPGNYTVTVTGTDANNVKQTATVTLTVQ